MQRFFLQTYVNERLKELGITRKLRYNGTYIISNKNPDYHPKSMTSVPNKNRNFPQAIYGKYNTPTDEIALASFNYPIEKTVCGEFAEFLHLLLHEMVHAACKNTIELHIESRFIRKPTIKLDGIVTGVLEKGKKWFNLNEAITELETQRNFAMLIFTFLKKEFGNLFDQQLSDLDLSDIDGYTQQKLLLASIIKRIAEEKSITFDHVYNELATAYYNGDSPRAQLILNSAATSSEIMYLESDSPNLKTYGLVETDYEEHKIS